MNWKSLFQFLKTNVTFLLLFAIVILAISYLKSDFNGMSVGTAQEMFVLSFAVDIAGLLLVSMLYAIGMFITFTRIVGKSVTTIIAPNLVFLINAVHWQTVCLLALLVVWDTVQYAEAFGCDLFPGLWFYLLIVIVPVLNFVGMWISGIFELDPDTTIVGSINYEDDTAHAHSY